MLSFKALFGVKPLQTLLPLDTRQIPLNILPHFQIFTVDDVVYIGSHFLTRTVKVRALAKNQRNFSAPYGFFAMLFFLIVFYLGFFFVF